MVQQLVEPERRLLDEQLRGLIEQNYALGMPKEGFLYGGVFHSLIRVQDRAKATKKMLHKDLREEARHYMAAEKLFEQEKTRLHNGLTFMLSPCKNEQDMRDMLPDSMKLVLPQPIASLRRTRPPAWAFETEEMFLGQFKELENVIDYYISNRII